MTRPATNFSFEFFPTRNAQAQDQLDRSAIRLDGLKPAFMTVTFGAGGSEKNGTMDTLMRLNGRTQSALAAHLTFSSSTKDQLADFTDKLWAQGIRHIVALRGDIPQGVEWPRKDGSHFEYTSDFVAWLKTRYPFQISVGAYPEKHPDAPSLDADIIALKKKCDAGADRAITQFFFDNDVYFRFVDKAQAAGIKTPIVPGVLPVMNFTRMKQFADKCGANVPAEVEAQFRRYADGSDDAVKFGEEFLMRQCDDLVARGVDHIHFYTLNVAQPLERVCRHLAPRP